MATCPCPFCVNEDEGKHLLSTPLRSLTEEELCSYSESVFLTVGGIDDFKYLLPRLFETWIFTEGWRSLGVEVWLGKLRLAGWTFWSAAEQDAVRDVLWQWYQRYLDIPGLHCRSDGKKIHTWDGNDFICGLGRADVDLEPYLHVLLKQQYREQLAAVYRDNFDDELSVLRLVNAFWEEFPEAGEPLLGFLRSLNVEEKVAAEFAATGTSLRAPPWGDVVGEP